jgi:hypothetical protein
MVCIPLWCLCYQTGYSNIIGPYTDFAKYMHEITPTIYSIFIHRAKFSNSLADSFFADRPSKFSTVQYIVEGLWPLIELIAIQPNISPCQTAELTCWSLVSNPHYL